MNDYYFLANQANLLSHAADMIADAMSAIGTEELSELYGWSISDVEESLRSTAKELVKWQHQYEFLMGLKNSGMKVSVKTVACEWYEVGEIYPATREVEIILGKTGLEEVTGKPQLKVIGFADVLEWIVKQ